MGSNQSTASSWTHKLGGRDSKKNRQSNRDRTQLGGTKSSSGVIGDHPPESSILQTLTCPGWSRGRIPHSKLVPRPRDVHRVRRTRARAQPRRVPAGPRPGSPRGSCCSRNAGLSCVHRTSGARHSWPGLPSGPLAPLKRPEAIVQKSSRVLLWFPPVLRRGFGFQGPQGALHSGAAGLGPSGRSQAKLQALQSKQFRPDGSLS